MIQPSVETIFIQFITYIEFVGLLTIVIVIIRQYLQYKNKLKTTGKLEEPERRYSNSNLDNQTLNEYAIRLSVFFEETKLYLRSDLSLDLLSQETNIPKHHFSQLFNVYFNKNFYQVIADYRIAYAIEVLNKGGNIKMDSLAYTCGYNSTTSFNRYFKKKIGQTPSRYRDTLNIKSKKMELV